MAALLNPPKEGGIVLSNSFNLTRISLLLSTLIGLITAAMGALANVLNDPTTTTTTTPGTAEAPPTTTTTTTPDADPFNFDSNQRLVIIVAVIAAFAIVSAADILGRSIATGKAVSVGLVPLTKPQEARQNLSTKDPDPDGFVYAVRGGAQPTYLFQGKDGAAIWIPADQVTFTKKL